MRDKLKRLLLACMLVLSLGLLAGCTQSEAAADTGLTPDMELMLNQQGEAILDQMLSLSDEDIDLYIEEFNLDQDTVRSAGFTSWKNAKDDLGAYISVEDAHSEKKKDGGYETVLNLKFEKRNCTLTLGVDRKLNDMTEMNFSPDYTTGELIEEAAGNLVVGMGTVFVVLAIIMCVISCFRFIPKDLGQKKEKAAKDLKAPAAPQNASEAPVPAVQNAEEIEAVIAAAIAAYEADCGRPAGESLRNGLVVRSIRRQKTR